MKSKSFNAVIFETLDSRCLLSGSVVGTTFVDTHGEGNQSLYRYPVGPVNPYPKSVEPWAGNLSVYIDLDHSDTLTPADRVTQTSQYGNWNFYQVPAGSYKVYVVPPAEYDAWQPDGVAVEVVDDVSLNDVVLTLKPANSRVTTVDIIDDKGENFEGYIYIDSNNNGVRDAGELTQVTEPYGTNFIGLPDGVHHLRTMVVNAEFAVTGGDAGGDGAIVLVIDSQTTDATYTFEITALSSISGQVSYNPNGRNASPFSAVRFPEGVEVFLDLNNNGARDNDEPFTLTDANGQYKFNGLTPGEYTVCIEKPIGARELDSQSDLVQWTSATRYHGNSANFSLAAQSKRFDYNSDGKADLVMRNDATGQNEIWLMDGLKRIGIQELPALNGNWKMVGTADLDGNGERDILWHNTNSGANVVWMYQGGQRLSYALEPLGSQWELAGSGGDWNNDGRDDLVWYNKNTGDTTIWFMRGYYHRGAQTIARVANLDWKITAVADFDGTGTPELLWTNSATGQGSYWRNIGATISQWDMKSAPHASMAGWKISSFADLNADGVLDIVWTDGSRNAVWLMNLGGPRFPMTAVYASLLV